QCCQSALIGDVQSRDADVAHRSRTFKVLMRLRVVMHPAEAEIQQQRTAERLGSAHGHAVVMNVRTAGKSRTKAESSAAGFAQGRCPRQAVPILAITAKYVHGL